ncbi:hypothetical protein FA046_09200 [Pedobacter cryophilus]|uniref:Uncharacterized protein n=1 Tax=Pedobacter cryophilus TaxID=2571271 RepID=A0A4U1C1G1_9SPHI|nr:hypothetical protein FA046_09200 [Pedobacter cryophilus]
MLKLKTTRYSHKRSIVLKKTFRAVSNIFTLIILILLTK